MKDIELLSQLELIDAAIMDSNYNKALQYVLEMETIEDNVTSNLVYSVTTLKNVNKAMQDYYFAVFKYNTVLSLSMNVNINDYEGNRKFSTELTWLDSRVRKLKKVKNELLSDYKFWLEEM